MTENIFLHISILLALTVTIAFIMRMLRQPLIVAYIVAGIIAGPFLLRADYDGQNFFNAFAQLGIVLLLFAVGLSLNIEYVRRVGTSVFIGAALQFFITAGLGFGALYFMGFEVVSSLFVAVAITFSSTIVVMKLLADKKDLETVYGRYVTGLLLIQDIIAVGILIFLNNTTGEMLWYETLALGMAKVVALFFAIFIMAKFLLPLIMDRVARSTELLFVFTIAWCFCVASLVYWAGFGLEIGAVIAGLSLGSSPYQKEISSRIRPLRDFFIIIFFIVLGSELQLAGTHDVLVPGLVLSLFVLIVEPLVLYFVMRRLKHTRRTAFLAGITAAQVSEFAFILAFKAREAGYLFGSELEILTVVALVTIVVSSYLIEYGEKIYRFIMPFLHWFGKDHHQPREVAAGDYTVWVFGYHRIGWKVCEALKEKGLSFAVVDVNPDTIAKVKSRGIPAFFGDAADVEFLSTLPLQKAQLIISTLPAPDDQLTLIKHVRHLSKKPFIIANVYQKVFLDELYAAGADYVMMPHLLGGMWAADFIKHKPWEKRIFSALRASQKKEMKLRFTLGGNTPL